MATPIDLSIEKGERAALLAGEVLPTLKQMADGELIDKVRELRDHPDEPLNMVALRDAVHLEIGLRILEELTKP